MGKLVKGVSAGCLLTVAGLVAKVGLYPTFEQAKEFEFLRGRYVQNAVREKFPEFPEYLASVEYVDSGDIGKFRKKYELADKDIMLTDADATQAENIGNKKIVSRIFIFPEAFTGDVIFAPEDFNNTLLSHEIAHAKHYFEGFPSIPKIERGRGIDQEVFVAISELSALREEIANFPKGASSRYKIKTLGSYMIHYSSLWRLKPEQLKEDSVERVKNLFFEYGWMPRSNVFVEKNGNYFIIDPVTEATLQLPDSVAEKLRGK